MLSWLDFRLIMGGIFGALRMGLSWVDGTWHVSKVEGL